MDVTIRSTQEARTGSRWNEVALQALVVALIAGVWYIISDPLFTLRLGGAVGTVGYSVLTFRETRKTPLRLSLLSAYFAFSVIANGIAPILVAEELSEQGYVRFVTVLIFPEALAKGWIIILVGSLAWHAGIEAGDRLPPLPAARLVAGRLASGLPSVAALIAFWLAGTVSIFIKEILRDNLGSVGSVVDRAPMAALVILLLSGPTALGIRRRVWVILAGVGFFINLLLSFTMNSKSQVMLVFLPLFWFLIFRRSRLLVPSALFFVAFYATVAHPVIQETRRIASEYNWRYGFSVIQAIDDAGGVRALGDSRGGATVSLWEGVSRFFQATSVGFLTDEVERTGFLEGATFREIGVALIPRLLWPDKPIVTRGTVFREMIAGDMWGGGGAIAFSAAGEFYWNFGIAGVVTGMLFLGVLYRVVYGLAARPDTSLVRMVLFLQLLPGSMEASDAQSVVVGLIGATVLFSGLLWIETLFRDRSGRGLQPSGGPALFRERVSRKRSPLE